MPHRKIGHLNYLSNSNLDYNNALNVRRVGAFAGIGDIHHMHGSHHHGHVHKMGMMHKHNPSYNGLVHGEMGGLEEIKAHLSIPLVGGLALLAYPHTKKGKKMKKKHKQASMIAGLGMLAYHFFVPSLGSELDIEAEIS